MKLWVAGLLLVALAALVGLLLFRPAEPPAPSSVTPGPAQVSGPADAVAAPSASASPDFAKNLAGPPLEEITNAQVSHVSRKENRYVLHLLDGRQVEVYPFELDRLPSELRLRVEYQRER